MRLQSQSYASCVPPTPFGNTGMLLGTYVGTWQIKITFKWLSLSSTTSQNLKDLLRIADNPKIRKLKMEVRIVPWLSLSYYNTSVRETVRYEVRV